MKQVDNNGQKSPYPPYNYSVKYYTDQIHFADTNCEYEENEAVEGAVDKKENEFPDEPVESWGWVNNVD